MKDEPQPPTKDDDLADAAGELILEANEQLEQNRQEQKQFLDAVSEEEGAEVLETQCNLIGDITAPLSAKLNGELIDRMSDVQETGKQIEANPEAEGHKVSRVADEMCLILADVVDDSTLDKSTFYQAYREEGLDPMLTMLDRAFESLKDERERRQGVADGFRAT